MTRADLTKAFSIHLLVLSSFFVQAAAQDTLIAIFDRENFVQGDSIEMEVYTEPYRSHAPAKTLHLWIDNIRTGQRWKYRYPLVKGRCNIGLRISDSIPNGTYAFNFLLQDKFLTIKGKLLSEEKTDSSVNYFANAKKKVPIIEEAMIQPGGFFIIDNLFFTDSVFFSFSPAKQKKGSKLRISIETPLDSVFIAGASVTEFINIGKRDSPSAGAGDEKNRYAFDAKGMNQSNLLKEVVVQAKGKKPIDEYKEKYVSGLFGNEDAKTIDFLGSEEALSFPDLFTYLTFKIPFLVQKVNSDNGQQFLTYRNETVDIYVDEFLENDFSQTSVSIQDVAMVKFFSQSFRLGGGIMDNGIGGSLVIYTKKPQDKKGNKLSNYTFLIRGYTSLAGEWK
jgi:hypothetical protein